MKPTMTSDRLFALGAVLAVAASLFRTIFLLGVFLPFSYMMDTFLYRSYQRRTGAGGGKR